MDLNCLKLGEPCIYHKGWLIITFTSSFVGPDLDLNYLNNSNLDQTHHARREILVSIVCVAPGHIFVCTYFIPYPAI